MKSEARPPQPARSPAVEVVNRQRLHAINRAAVARLSRAVLDRVGLAQSTATVTFIRDAAMRRLNRDYRGKDAPTDVLAFAYHEDEIGQAREQPPEHLGDVVISVETAERYAGELGLTFAREVEWLVIHGLLHLAGYDHETDTGEMRRLEGRLRKELLR
jgi:probable rRNA maturation factor